MQHAARNWRREKQAAVLYRALSDLESGTPRQLLFLELAKDADSEAMHWELELKKAGLAAPAHFLPGPLLRLVLRLLPWTGAAVMRPLLAACGLRGLDVFDSYAQTADPVSRSDPRARADVLYAIHDGQLALLCLLLLMAGAGVRPQLMLFAGVAGLLTGALAMAAGEALSRRARDAGGEELLPDLRGLSAVYARRGMEAGAATQQARRVLLDLELLDPAQPLTVRRPAGQRGVWLSSLVAFFCFAGGAAIPLLPYLLEVQRHPLMMGCSIAAVSLFVLGWSLAVARRRVGLWGGLRSVALAVLWAGAAYLCGALLGAVI